MGFSQPTSITHSHYDQSEYLPPIPDLPSELKLKIWKHAVDAIEPRRIFIGQLYDHSRLLSVKDRIDKLPPQSAFLQVCHASRIAYLKSYTVWGSYITDMRKIPGGQNLAVDESEAQQKFSYAYINFAKDTVCLEIMVCEQHAKKRKLVTFVDRWYQGNDERYRFDWHPRICQEGNGAGRIRKGSAIVYTSWSNIESSIAKDFEASGLLTEREFLGFVLGLFPKYFTSWVEKDD